MSKNRTINYRDCEITYFVFGENKDCSATAKLVLNVNEQEIIKSIVLPKVRRTEIQAEEKILEASVRALKQIYGKSTLVNNLKPS